MFRKSFTRWEDIAEFFAIDEPQGMVALRYAPHHQGQAAARRFASRLARAEAGLPDTYGRSAPELAGFLNKIRAEQSRPF